MKKFLMISFILFFIALLIVVSVFLYISFQLNQSQSQVTNSATNESSVTQETTSGTAAVPTVAPEGIPLRNLQLNDSQRSVLNTIGVDVDTFVITPEIQTCAAAKLGDERMADIIAGDAPSVIETTKLVSCL